MSSWLCVALQYKSTPGKKVSIVGWMVQLPDDPEHPDIFQLNNPDKGRRRAGARSPSRPSLFCCVQALPGSQLSLCFRC